MTRNDFLNNVTEWWELLDFCSDEGCYICEDIIDSDQLDEYVEEDIRDTNYSWRDIRDSLSEIPTGYGYYRMNGSFDYDGMDENDFDSYKDDVLEWGDNNGVWEDEPDEDDDFDTDAMFNEEDSEPDESPVEDEDFSIGELMGFCGVVLLDIRREEAAERAREDEAFNHQHESSQNSSLTSFLGERFFAFDMTAL